jgi:two-component system CheB/CheR fusion protein
MRSNERYVAKRKPANRAAQLAGTKRGRKSGSAVRADKRRGTKSHELNAADAAAADDASAGSPGDAPPAVAFPVVGIGASAGGLDAFVRLLKALPAEPGMAIVIVQHLSPDYESALTQLLGHASPIRVLQVTDGMRLQVDHVYVIPPDRNMAITPDGRFSLVARPERKTQFMPIDFFLHSLARFARERAVGVILSGDLSDGSFGIKEIKGAGGITFAQEPRTASRGEMPRSAIATGLVDRAMPPEQIGEELLAIARHPLLRLAAPRRPAAQSRAGRPGRAGRTTLVLDPLDDGLDPEHLKRVFAIVRGATGVDFTHYKLPTIRRRLARRMVLHKITDLADYVTLLREQSGEVQALYADVLINVTRFFREPESFQALIDKALPDILAAHGANHGGGGRRRRAVALAAGGAAGDAHPTPLRVWVPGCSTGEEPYSVAIALLEQLERLGIDLPVQIFATDVSEAAIEHARAGVYPESIAADVTPGRLRRFFNRVDGNYRISKSVRDLCIFARQDLTRDPPFSRLDIVVCRNVLIYLGPVLQKRLMQVFHYALNPHGFLMLGNAETVGVHGDLFGIVDTRHRLYLRKHAGHMLHRLNPHTALPGTMRSGDGHGDGSGPRSGGDGRGASVAGAIARGDVFPGPVTSGDPRPANHIQSEANRILLNRFTPPGVIVDADFAIVQFRGQTGAYLEPAPGEASLNLLKMAREGLLYSLRTALHEARRSDTSVRKDGLRVRYGNGWRELSVEVIPLIAMGESRHFLVLFEDVHAAGGPGDMPGPGHVDPRSSFAAAATRVPGNGASGKAPPGKKGRGAAAAANDEDAAGAKQRIARLEYELQASREYLQSIIQDLEAANEELQSANEEILSANEELQSTNEELDTAKEELQSTNEELNTVNEELSGRNEELNRVNSDLVNLLASVQIAIVMVANDLKIRRFTPMAERLLNLIPTDVGRPISDIKPNVDIPDLEKQILESIETTSVRESTVKDRKGNTFSLRIRPYKDLENKIDGAVVVLIDVGKLLQPLGKSE